MSTNSFEHAWAQARGVDGRLRVLSQMLGADLPPINQLAALPNLQRALISSDGFTEPTFPVAVQAVASVTDFQETQQIIGLLPPYYA